MNLRELRDAMGLSVAQVAEELGIPKADIEESVDELGIFFDELLDKMLY